MNRGEKKEGEREALVNPTPRERRIELVCRTRPHGRNEDLRRDGRSFWERKEAGGLEEVQLRRANCEMGRGVRKGMGERREKREREGEGGR